MHLTCLAERLGRYCALTSGELNVLEGLWAGTRAVRRGTVVRAERDRTGEMFVVSQGWLFCSMLLEDGRRQIIRFHVRGDLLAGDTLGFPEAPDAITALTDAELHLLDIEAFGRLFEREPRLAKLFYTVLHIEQVGLTERLTSLGRSSAKGRVAALLLWVAERLRLAEPTRDGSFTLPMTQEEIGDACGLTAVHVNRTLRALEEQRLIERSRSMLRLLDPDRLARLANRPVRQEVLRDGWLPAAG